MTTEYIEGKYGNYNIIIMSSNGYINATELCLSHNKRFNTWRYTKKNKRLIKYVSNSLIKISNSNTFNGIYVHPLLLPHIVFWLSPTTTISSNTSSQEKQDNIEEDYKVWNDYKARHRIQMEAYDKQRIEQNIKIEELHKKINRIRIQADEYVARKSIYDEYKQIHDTYESFKEQCKQIKRNVIFTNICKQYL